MSTPGSPALQDRCPNATRIPQLPVNNQQNINLDSPTRLASSTTSDNYFVPPTDDKTNPQSNKPPISLTGTTNHAAAGQNQECTMSSPEPEISSTSSYKSLSPSNDTTESQSEKLPTSPQSTINHQLPVNQQDGTTFLENPQNIYPQFRAQPPCEGERNLYSVQKPYQSTVKKRPLPGYTANSQNSTTISERNSFMVGECVRFLCMSCLGSLNERMSAVSE